jgi:hypothetical protein
MNTSLTGRGGFESYVSRKAYMLPRSGAATGPTAGPSSAPATPSPSEFTSEFDPEYPEDRYLVVNIKATGEI